MLNFHIVFGEYLESVKIDIQQVLKSQRRRATGNAIDSLRIVYVGGKAELRGARYIQNLVTGVGSQPKGISRQLIRNLKTWALFKGIEARAVWPIALSLVRKGTAIKRGQPGVNLKQIMKDNKTELLKGVNK